MTKPPAPPQLTENAGGDAYATFAHRESHDAYGRAIVDCRNGWRVIVCKAGKQYVAQKRSSRTNTGVWIGKSHCTTRSKLLSACSRLKLLSDATVMEVLKALPEYARDYKASGVQK